MEANEEMDPHKYIYMNTNTNTNLAAHHERREAIGQLRVSQRRLVVSARVRGGG